MRLWHESLIPALSDKHIIAQHRECCALRGKGWGRKHSTVNYVFDHNPARLVAYHYIILDEMAKRGFSVDSDWYEADYRGKNIGFQDGWVDQDQLKVFSNLSINMRIYPEHNEAYYKECVENLHRKGFLL